jgi:iron complex transport system ATP-binding protein
MKDGKIIADGEKKDILKEELLSDVYGANVFVDERNGLYTAWC